MQEIIAESHGYWKNLVKGKAGVNYKKFATNQTSNPRFCKSYIPSNKTTEAFKIPAASNIQAPAKRPEEYDRWFYLDKDFEVVVLPGQ